jgi:hypothetical protein
MAIRRKASAQKTRIHDLGQKKPTHLVLLFKLVVWWPKAACYDRTVSEGGGVWGPVGVDEVDERSMQEQMLEVVAVRPRAGPSSVVFAAQALASPHGDDENSQVMRQKRGNHVVPHPRDYTLVISRGCVSDLGCETRMTFLSGERAFKLKMVAALPGVA